MESLEERIVRLLDNLPAVEADFSRLSELSQRAILQSQVFSAEPDLFVFKEVQKQSILQLDIMFERLRHLSEGHSRWSLLVDLRAVSAPDAELRAYLRENYASLENHGLRFISLVVANRVIQMAVRLVGKTQFRIPFACSNNFGDAIRHIQDARNQHAPKNELS